MRLLPDRKWHKYKREETYSKLEATALWKRASEVTALIEANPAPAA
jgi:hypothetical protein